MSAGLKDVLDNDYCIGCGACVFADESLRLELHSKKLMYEPTAEGNELARSVCPSVKVDYQELISKLYPNAAAGPLGVVKSLFLAQSNNLERNLKSSSGGMIKELSRYLLSQGEIDGVISLKEQPESGGLLYKPELISNAEDIDSLPGSIYHSIPFDNALRILKENDGRFLLISNPCQLEGIYNYIFNVEPELKAKLHSTIGLVCGWTFTHHSVNAICSYKGLDPAALEEISYRGGGPVGKLRLQTKEAEKKVNRRVDFSYQVAFDRSFNVPRCHLCINHTNVLADLVVADAWLPSTIKTRTGISLMLCRTEAAEQMLQSLRKADLIKLQQVSEDDMVESQTRNVAYGDFSYSYAKYLKDKGEYCPELIGPNKAAAKLAPPASIEKFHRNLKTKIALQRQGRYRTLWFRKMTLEGRPFVMRYIRWFFVRVLRIKSILGLRKEIDSSLLKDFH